MSGPTEQQRYIDMQLKQLERIAELEAENARLKERMDVVLHAGPSTSIAVHAFDRCIRLERERDEARALTESWKSQVLDRETMLNEARAACAAKDEALRKYNEVCRNVLEGFDIYSWSPEPPEVENAKCTQVHLHMKLQGLGVALVRFKGPGPLDRLIAALQEQRAHVWGKP